MVCFADICIASASVAIVTATLPSSNRQLSTRGRSRSLNMTSAMREENAKPLDLARTRACMNSSEYSENRSPGMSSKPPVTVINGRYRGTSRLTQAELESLKAPSVAANQSHPTTYSTSKFFVQAPPSVTPDGRWRGASRSTAAEVDVFRTTSTSYRGSNQTPEQRVSAGRSTAKDPQLAQQKANPPNPTRVFLQSNNRPLNKRTLSPSEDSLGQGSSGCNKRRAINLPGRNVPGRRASSVSLNNSQKQFATASR